MSHYVNCVICNARFDRDRVEYAVMGSRRYAHASCMLREAEKDPDYELKEIIDPADNVVCIYCKKPMHRVKDDCVMVTNGKYAHASCYKIESTRELTDKEKLEQYIKKLFNMDYVSPLIQKQIKNYVEDYEFTYSGILKALIYFKEVKQGTFSHEGIGIVPYVYKDARNYYYSIWLAQERNKNIQVHQFVPKVKEIKILSPTAKVKKRKVFTFLDEEVENGE